MTTMQAPRHPPHRSVARTLHAAGPASLFVAGDKGEVQEKELAPVMVLWIDSMQQDGWGRYDEKVCLDCATIGHLYLENDEVVVIALSRSGALYGGYMTIPKVAVKSIEPLVRPDAPVRARHRRVLGAKTGPNVNREQARGAARAAKAKLVPRPPILSFE